MTNKYCGGRPKHEFRSASRENYKKFCEEHPTVNITFVQFQSIIRTWNKKFVLNCLETGRKIKMPYGFGPIAIHRKKNKRFFTDKDGKEHVILPVDWKATLDDVENPEHKKIYLLNFHTEGYGFKWFWFKNEALFKFSDIWSFKPSKVNKTLLTKYLTDTKTKYYLKYREWYRRKFSKVNS